MKQYKEFKIARQTAYALDECNGKPLTDLFKSLIPTKVVESIDDYLFIKVLHPHDIAWVFTVKDGIVKNHGYIKKYYVDLLLYRDFAEREGKADDEYFEKTIFEKLFSKSISLALDMKEYDRIPSPTY